MMAGALEAGHGDLHSAAQPTRRDGGNPKQPRPADPGRAVETSEPSQTGRPDLRLEVVDTLEHPPGGWTELAERSGNIFATWEWASVWWRHFGRSRRLLVTTLRATDGRTVAILPLYLRWSTRPIRTVRFLGHGPADQAALLCDPADRQMGPWALQRALAECPLRWDIFLGERLPGDEDWSSLPGVTRLRREGSPVVRIDGRSWDSFLASKSRNFRQQVRRRERRLAKQHEVRFRLSDDPKRLGDDLDVLFELHEARWGRRGSRNFAGVHKAFHRDFAALALDRGWLRLWTMEVDGTPVAAWCGYRFGGAEYYYQSGRDPAWDRASVGFVLLAHSIREAFNDGMHEYRLLRGGEAYKGRFASEDPGLETIGLARGVAARALLAGAVAARGARFPGRRLLARLAE
ncbi:hypothetical protein LCGC14_1745150 [marine sediment metagenome]|uniref:BioF2-like acetyltransferase domain-containing protein n=1 Tax=marine sediment metagenome TaxID=412755 RepID=A0A0F9HT63_9ZZZZ